MKTYLDPIEYEKERTLKCNGCQTEVKLNKKVVKYTWKQKLASGAVADPITFCMKCKIEKEKEAERQNKLKEEKEQQNAK